VTSTAQPFHSKMHYCASLMPAMMGGKSKSLERSRNQLGTLEGGRPESDPLGLKEVRFQGVMKLAVCKQESGSDAKPCPEWSRQNEPGKRQAYVANQISKKSSSKRVCIALTRPVLAIFVGSSDFCHRSSRRPIHRRWLFINRVED
jgi:hypothetical protein